ncbi:hypothetical protein ASC64_09055 [Nocardioides sp. Root122]|uniref:CG0192-related protein n=1 Tax=Nocardioides TaxID=1839 RepID=UPI00070354A7|nr:MULTISPECIES: hypothetical protein [Nocardioides]KQV69932.1 hypothetical protein ASC64_09055 [Nocardioides sp. Root122]MCK9822827.1 hypothetical protein [Nocardioides cavernae]
MGIVHRATLTPSKQELVESWLPSRGWAAGRRVVDKVGEYRLDDPAGEVGVETILWRADDGAVLQTPLTYRAEPLDGADAHLIGTCDHSVLGRRWVYDACGDPVWATTLVAAIRTGGAQSPMYFEQDGERIDIPARVEVRGSGSADSTEPVAAVDSVSDDGDITTVAADATRIALARVVGTPLGEGEQLSGTIVDGGQTSVLAVLVKH